ASLNRSVATFLCDRCTTAATASRLLPLKERKLPQKARAVFSKINDDRPCSCQLRLLRPRIASSQRVFKIAAASESIPPIYKRPCRRVNNLKSRHREMHQQIDTARHHASGDSVRMLSLSEIELTLSFRNALPTHPFSRACSTLSGLIRANT